MVFFWDFEENNNLVLRVKPSLGNQTVIFKSDLEDCQSLIVACFLKVNDGRVKARNFPSNQTCADGTRTSSLCAPVNHVNTESEPGQNIHPVLYRDTPDIHWPDSKGLHIDTY